MEIPFFARYLSRGERLAEILFGLVMTLSFTLTADVMIGTPEEGAVRELILATIGCNVAWGIIDGGLLILGRAFDRGRFARIGQAIRGSRSDEPAIAAIASELDDILEPLAGSESRKALYRDIMAKVRASQPHRTGVRGEDFIAAFCVFVLVAVATVPAVLPFLLISDPAIAVRVSNAVLIVLLFVIGYNWAGHTSINRWRAAITLTVFGMAMVATAIALGG